jgi:acyl-CoA reductase-like NAD-dependent aldehyde dehydrogenase
MPPLEENAIMTETTTATTKSQPATTDMTTNDIPKINNYIHGIKQKGSSSLSSSYIPVSSPTTSNIIAHVYKSNKDDVEYAIESSKKAFESWSNMTIKSRITILMKFNYLVKLHAKELAELIVQENGKNITEGT